MISMQNLRRTGVAAAATAVAMVGLTSTGAAATTATESVGTICPEGYVCLYGDFALFPYAEYNQPGVYNASSEVPNTRVFNNLNGTRSVYACSGLNGSGVCYGPLPEGPAPAQFPVKSIRITW